MMIEKEIILITGANGFLGSNLINHLINETDFNILAAATSEDKIRIIKQKQGLADTDRIQGISNEKLLSRDYNLSNIYAAIHMAFSRRMRPEEQIASSIDFSAHLFYKLRKNKVNNIIYLSSAGVYGNHIGIRTEKTPPAPNSLYSMAKYAAEKVFDAYFEELKDVNRTCLRLGSVIQSQNLVQALCKQAKQEGVLRLIGGKQEFTYIDVEDAVGAIAKLLQYKGQWKRIYNVDGMEMPVTLLDIAAITVQVAQMRGYQKPDIELVERDIELRSGMDFSQFIFDTGWKPRYSLMQMVERIFDAV